MSPDRQIHQSIKPFELIAESPMIKYGNDEKRKEDES